MSKGNPDRGAEKRGRRLGREPGQLRRVREVLRESEEKSRAILQSIEELYYEVDLAGNLVAFNPSMTEILGYSKEELMGMNNRRYMDEETTKKVYRTFNQVYRTGLPTKAFDWDLIRKDGARRILETSVSLMCDSKGRPIGFYGIGRDITERKKAEKILRKSEEKYRTTLQSIEEGYYEVDLAGDLTFFNNALVRFSGYLKEELMGMNTRRLMTEEAAQKMFQIFKEVYQTGEPANPFDWEMVRRDGTKRIIETSVSLVQDSRGKPTGYRGIARDITDRKKMEEQAKIHQQQLMQAGKMVALGTLVSSVAHEINNPNNFIMLNTPLLSEAWECARPILDEYHEKNGDFSIGGMKYTEMRDSIPVLFSGIRDGSKRIKQIVEDLKDFVRRDTSEMTQPVDMNAVLRSAISLLSNTIMKSTNHFSVAYEENLSLIKGNFQRFEQVMINLIQNACQALPNNRRGIFVSTSHDERRTSVVVEVEDEGTGISLEMLSHITDPFFTTKSDSGGLGLGLSISSRIVKEHGGTLTFASEPGKGTRAKIVLPISQANSTTMEINK
jgi:PAS domain S-box-containing protein